MSESSSEKDSSLEKIGLVDKPIEDMIMAERKEWYKEYMKMVSEENVMFVSGLAIEIVEDPEAFRCYVTAYQQLRRQGLE